MNLIGEKVTSARYGIGTITSIDSGYMTIQFDEKVSKFKYPDAFQKHISLENEALQSEMNAIAAAAVEEKVTAEEKAKAQKYKEFMESVEAAKAPVKKETDGAAARKNRTAGSRSAVKTKEEPRVYAGRVIDRNTSFFTHAETLNACFGYHYKHFQKAYKDLDNGYAVWFPRIAKKVGSQYLSLDNYWGWLNILSENGDTITQMDNPDFPYSGTEPDKNKRIIFARFEGDDRYRFVGIYKFGQRIQNGEIFTRIGTKLDTQTMKIIE